ncbi:MAG: phosphatase domain-containing protein [Alphaproteobacteria bacterium]
MSDRPFILETYRGYGARGRAVLRGRIYREPARRSAYLRRLARRGIGDIAVTGVFGGVEAQARTDRDGYFRLVWESLDDGLTGWQDVSLNAAGTSATGEVHLRGGASRFVVISDIDDTVMVTGVANKAAMYWRLFLQSPDSRRVFPGVPDFYRALRDGAGGAEDNPVLFVSRGPWSIYDALSRFFANRGVAERPILLLREWGLTLQSPVPRRARVHKRELIDEILSVYGDADCVLIGDNNQRDPALYAGIAASDPGRIRAVYIRDVAGTGKAEPLQGVPIVISAETDDMLRHAADVGLIVEVTPR